MPKYPVEYTVLAAKRRELATEIRLTEQKLEQLRADLVHIDAAIRIIAPGADVEKLGPKRSYTRSTLFPSRDIGRRLIDILRREGDWLTAKELAERLAADCRIATDDPAILPSLAFIAGQALRRARGKGQVQSQAVVGTLELRWALPSVASTMPAPLMPPELRESGANSSSTPG